MPYHSLLVIADDTILAALLFTLGGGCRPVNGPVSCLFSAVIRPVEPLWPWRIF
jgi:hypothetical protein